MAEPADFVNVRSDILIFELQQYKNLNAVKNFLECIPDRSWSLLEENAFEIKKYDDVFRELIKTDIPVYSEINAQCDDAELVDWLIGIICENHEDDFNSAFIFPFMLNTDIWCRIQFDYVFELIRKKAAYIRLKGICFIDTACGVIYDVEYGESTLECRIAYGC